MAYSVLLHIANTEAILAEIEDLPDPSSVFIVCTNPRAKDGKPISFIDAEATKFIFPWQQLTFVEIYPNDEEGGEIESFFRD